MLRKLLIATVVYLISGGVAFAQSGALLGTVTNATTGESIAGANIYIQKLQTGGSTDTDGRYKISNIPPGTYTVRVTYVGFKKIIQSIDISSGTNTENFKMKSGISLSEVVVTGALGQKQSLNSVTFASQKVDPAQLNIAQPVNLKSSLAGKVAGIQILGQAGSKLGTTGSIRIRGQIALTSTTSDPLYVVDGVVGVSPNNIDINNVEDVNVLKGPNATALYGQRGEDGVIVITSKGANAGVSVEINEALTVQKVAYIPNFQNEYGQGYDGQLEWKTFEYRPGVSPEYFKNMDGVKYLNNSYADESWGPRLDGTEYGAWYNWFPDSPYYGETSTFSPRPDNVKNFYGSPTTNKANLAVNYTKDNYSARISYTNTAQTGLLPSTDLARHLLGGKLNYDVTEAFHVGVDLKYRIQSINGLVRSDGYGNQTTGTFNNWFGRQVNVKKLRELQNLTTPEGIQTNWNWWGPQLYGTLPAQYDEGYKKPAFWFNPYTYQSKRVQERNLNNFIGALNLAYELGDNWELSGSATRDDYNSTYRTETPFTFEQSSDQTGALYNYFVNNFGMERYQSYENNFSGELAYKNTFDDWTLDAFGGSVFRMNHNEQLEAYVSGSYQSGGLIIPNIYNYSNARSPVVPSSYFNDKQVFSLYGRTNIGYKDIVYVNASYRKDWSSALPSENNGYGYPSVGASLVFSELLAQKFDALSYGKIRVGWAQVGSDVGAGALIGSYRLSDNPFNNPVTGEKIPKIYTDDDRIDPNIKPAINSSYEAGLDLGFFNDRIELSGTFYSEIRKDDIIGVNVSTATGVENFLTNAGKVSRKGVELSLDATPVQNRSFRWKTTLNWAANHTVIEALPQDLKRYSLNNSTFGFAGVTQVLGKEWGQLQGAAIKRNDQGQPIVNSNGLFAAEQDHNYGSVLPDFTGGWQNNFTYKGFGLAASVDFQKGGKFFSLSEQWGQSGGLLDETVGNNDLGNPKRDYVYKHNEDGSTFFDDDGNRVLLPEDQRGGVHVTGVDADGNPVDLYVDAQKYYGQWIDNSIAEPFVHDASYIKLRELSLSYNLPKRFIGSFLNSVRFSLITRNVLMIAVSGDNNNRWDPSELSRTFGENGQLPGTRSFGFNAHITF